MPNHKVLITAFAAALVAAVATAHASAKPHHLFSLTDNAGTVTMTVRHLSPDTQYTEAFKYITDTGQTCTGTWSGYQTDSSGAYSLSLPETAYTCGAAVSDADLYVWLTSEGESYFSSVTLADGSHATGELSLHA